MVSLPPIGLFYKGGVNYMINKEYDCQSSLFNSIRTNRNVAYHTVLSHFILLKRSFSIGYAVFRNKKVIFVV